MHNFVVECRLLVSTGLKLQWLIYKYLGGPGLARAPRRRLRCGAPRLAGEADGEGGGDDGKAGGQQRGCDGDGLAQAHLAHPHTARATRRRLGVLKEEDGRFRHSGRAALAPRAARIARLAAGGEGQTRARARSSAYTTMPPCAVPAPLLGSAAAHRSPEAREMRGMRRIRGEVLVEQLRVGDRERVGLRRRRVEDGWRGNSAGRESSLARARR